MVVIFPEMVEIAESIMESKSYDTDDFYLRMGELQNSINAIACAIGPFSGEFIS